jgi:hypothetical protein
MPTTKVPGLLLISDRGAAYFIESGIKANKLAGSPNFDGVDGGTEFISLKDHLIPLADIQAQAEAWRAKWDQSNPKPYGKLPPNVGPIIFQAYNVEVIREDYGDGVISGNGTGLDNT